MWKSSLLLELAELRVVEKFRVGTVKPAGVSIVEFVLGRRWCVMDFLVFVAAASAGCLTKCLKSIPRGLKGSNATLNRSWSIGGLAHGKGMNGDGDASQNYAFDEKVLGNNPTAEVVTTSGSEEMIARNLEDCNFLSIAYVFTEYTANIANIAKVNEGTSDRDICSGSGDAGTGKFEGINCSFQRSVKSNSSLQSRYRHLQLKPSTSLESCLVAQLYNHNSEWEDGTRSSPRPSTSSMARPLLVTEDSDIISPSSDGFVRAQDVTEASGMQKRSHIERNRKVNGIPSLPSFPIQIRSDGSSGISIGSIGGRKFYTQNGSIHGIILFFLGICIGIISSAARKKTDMDNLKELLKHSESLVQDLQEELEMKDSVIVKELDNDMHVSRDTHQTSFPDADPTPSFNECHEGDVLEELYKPETGENLGCMGKIEAELEAELERLGLNVGLCNVRLNNMMVDIPKGRDLEKDGSSDSSMAPSVNYAVSPRALTLRLHEVIQSRLEERIQELELALENSQRKVLLMESAQKIRTRKRFFNDVARPVVMNLLGEALSAYDKAYEEILKFDSSEESTPSCRDNSPTHRSVVQNRTIEKIGFMNDVEPPFLHGAEAANGTLSYEQDTDSLDMSRDESSDADDEMLIRQLVERTKRGSPVMMKVQRLLFSDQGDRH